MTKTARILNLLANGIAPAAIAADVGCRSAYIRTVKQRAQHGGQRPCDRRWNKSDAYKAWRASSFRERYAADPAFAAKHREYVGAYRARKKAAQCTGKGSA